MRKKSFEIIHIYAGTSGSAGLYIDEIYNALCNQFRQEVIVNHYFPFKYGKKFFYKYSELSSPYLKNLKKSRLRYGIRLIELICGLFFGYFYIIFSGNVRIINYNLVSDLNIEYIFLRILKRTLKIKIAITCHDVKPFKSSYVKSDQQIHRKQKFFSIADVLFIHNNNSYDDLMNYYSINLKTQQIVQFPFPVMDLNRIEYKSENKTYNIPEKKGFRVGMVGHLRIEKGVQLLIDAWDEFYEYNKPVQLVIAGNLPSDESYDFEKIKNKNFILIDRFISDVEYFKLIESCDLIVLPYSRGTNSGIPSSIFSLNKLLIASDIDMFKNNQLIVKDFLFQNGNKEDLTDKLNFVFSLTENKKEEFRFKNRLNLQLYRKHFIEEINKCYSRIATT